MAKPKLPGIGSQRPLEAPALHHRRSPDEKSQAGPANTFFYPLIVLHGQVFDFAGQDLCSLEGVDFRAQPEFGNQLPVGGQEHGVVPDISGTQPGIDHMSAEGRAQRKGPFFLRIAPPTA